MVWNINISDRVKEKLLFKHDVTVDDVEEAFANRLGGTLEDTRAKNRTDPPTLWFISKTDDERLLKVVFMIIDNVYEIKTAYKPNELEIKIYEKYA